MMHEVLGLRAVADEAPESREAVLVHVMELRSMLAAQPPAVRRNLAQCITRAEDALLERSPEAAAHLRKLHKTVDFVSEMLADATTSLPLAQRAKALQRDLARPQLVVSG